MDTAFTKLLLPHSRALRRAADKGDTDAQRIINLYSLHRATPEDKQAMERAMEIAKEWIAVNG